jgi:hypothetical protein
MFFNLVYFQRQNATMRPGMMVGGPGGPVGPGFPIVGNKEQMPNPYMNPFFFPPGYMEYMSNLARPPFGYFGMGGGVAPTNVSEDGKIKSRERSRSRGKSRDSYKSSEKSLSYKSSRSKKSK